MIWVGPECNHRVLVRGRLREFDTDKQRGEGQGTLEADTGVMHLENGVVDPEKKDSLDVNSEKELTC